MVELVDQVVMQLLAFTSTITPELGTIMFAIFFLDELVIPIPYIVETIWVVIGYQMSMGVISFENLLTLWLISIFARLSSATLVYSTSAMYDKFLHNFLAMSKRTLLKKIIPKPFHTREKIKLKIALLTRFIGLRLPLSLTLSVKKQSGLLIVAILITSLLWDGTFTAIGYLTNVTRVGLVQTILVAIGLTILVNIIGRIFFKKEF